MHEWEDVPDGSGAEGRFSGDRALAAVGQGRAHHGQRLAIQFQGASLQNKLKIFEQKVLIETLRATFRFKLRFNTRMVLKCYSCIFWP